MQDHAVIHTGDKPFQCTQCDKRFNNKANLNKHRRIHTNQRPFVCNICGQTYRQNYDLKRHMTRHTGKKQFECEECGRCFARKSYLKRHMSTHSKEQQIRHECQICHRKFNQQRNLTLHIMKIHQSVGVVAKTSAPVTDSITTNTVSVKKVSRNTSVNTNNNSPGSNICYKRNNKKDVGAPITSPSPSTNTNTLSEKNGEKNKDFINKNDKDGIGVPLPKKTRKSPVVEVGRINDEPNSTANENDSNTTSAGKETTTLSKSNTLPTVSTVLPIKSPTLRTILLSATKTTNDALSKQESHQKLSSCPDDESNTGVDIDFLSDEVVKRDNTLVNINSKVDKQNTLQNENLNGADYMKFNNNESDSTRLNDVVEGPPESDRNNSPVDVCKSEIVERVKLNTGNCESDDATGSKATSPTATSS